MDELMFFRQLLSSDTGWVPAAYLLGLLTVLAFRPERIRLPGLFQWACVLFALSLMSGPVLNGLLWFSGLLLDGGMGRMPRPGSQPAALLPLMNASGPVLLGTSVLCATMALGPGRDPARSGAPARPPRHPLE